MKKEAEKKVTDSAERVIVSLCKVFAQVPIAHERPLKGKGWE